MERRGKSFPHTSKLFAEVGLEKQIIKESSKKKEMIIGK
jgi:hypothetical protein